MNRNKLALEIIKDLRQLGKSIENFLNEIEKSAEETFTSTEPAPMKAVPITLEQVRAVLAAMSQAGKQPEVKALITKHGGQKLTDLNPSCYEELLKEAEVL